MSVQKINPDTYVGNTGKQLKDIKTNADNISANLSKINNNTTKINNNTTKINNNTTNISKNTTDINSLKTRTTDLENIKIEQKYVSGDTIKTTTIAKATFTSNYQDAYLICIPISCASSSAEDTGLVIFKARSNDSTTNISYGIEKTNSAQCEIKKSGNTVNFNIKQTVQWRYLHCVIIAKSDNVTITIK